MPLEQERKRSTPIICLYINNTMIVGNEIERKKFEEEIKLHLKAKEDEDMKDYVVTYTAVGSAKYNQLIA